MSKGIKEKIKIMKRNIKREWDGSDVLVQGAIFSTAITSMLIGGMSIGKSIRKQNETTIKTEIKHQADNVALLEAAFDDNIDNFDKAIKNGANLKEAVNQYGRNALMISIFEGRSYDVAMHILKSPDLRKQIDYKQKDAEGKDLLAYIQDAIDNTSFKRSYCLPTLQEAQKIVGEQLNEQNKEEANGKARSNIKYDAFARIVKNNSGNTGL